MSGKAMQGADPPAGPAYCEMSRTESEGQARPLFLLRRGALARPKRAAPGPPVRLPRKPLQARNLSTLWSLYPTTPAGNPQVNKMHIPAHCLQDTIPLQGNQDRIASIASMC